MNRTKNDLSSATREAVVAILNARLADCIDLRLQAKQAHWNVKGPHFIALHELFDSVADHLEDFSDTIAERAVALGGTAVGTSQAVAKGTTLSEYPLQAKGGRRHVELLATGLAAFGASVRKAIDVADQAGDADTADLFTEVSRGVDQDLWFVEAHLEPHEV